MLLFLVSFILLKKLGFEFFFFSFTSERHNLSCSCAVFSSILSFLSSPLHLLFSLVLLDSAGNFLADEARCLPPPPLLPLCAFTLAILKLVWRTLDMLSVVWLITRVAFILIEFFILLTLWIDHPHAASS